MGLVPVHIKKMTVYEPGKSIEEIKKEYNLKQVIKLASNENPRGPSPAAMNAMVHSLKQVHRYPDVVNSDLRMALANGYDTKKENVLTGNGSEGIMSVIMRTFLLDDEEVLTSEGTFLGFYILAQSRGVQLRKVPLKNYQYDLNKIADQISEKTKIIYLANPNNPTGTIFTVREFLDFYNRVPQRVLIIMDEAYFEFSRDDPKYPDSMKYRFDNVITLRTFSKVYGLAGVRIGYGFAHHELVKNLMKVKMPFEPSVPAQAAGVGAMEDWNYVNETKQLNQIGLSQMYDLFDDLGIRYIHSHANFVMIDLETEKRAAMIYGDLLKNGVIVRPLKAFGLPQCLRITVGLPQEIAVLDETFRKILK